MKKMYIIYICIAVVLLVGGYFIYNFRVIDATKPYSRTDDRQKFFSNDLGKVVTYTGLAQNGKGGAILTVGLGSPIIAYIYIENLDYWPQDVVGKKVTVTGKLVEKKYIPSPEYKNAMPISQGTEGNQIVFEQATYREVKK